MRINLRGVRHIDINSEYIRLDALLKYASLAATGGEAKMIIQSGRVYVCGEKCLLRGRKIRPGDSVRHDDVILLIRRAAV